MEIIVGDITKPILIDEIDYQLVLDRQWYWINANVLGNTPKWYLTSVINRKTTYLHREIMDCPKGMVVDHINGNTFDMRRSNLRVTTQKENSKNRSKSLFKELPKGVYKKKNHNRYYSTYQKDGCKKYIGTFDTIDQAKNAYDSFNESLN